MKLINNFLCGVQVASLAEGLVWIERSGLDRDKALSILSGGLQAGRFSPRSRPAWPVKPTP
jgi:3-hydroxyisobutyrate dehydrogenase-like beta-hydroxyacid dehydrogenase